MLISSENLRTARSILLSCILIGAGVSCEARADLQENGQTKSVSESKEQDLRAAALLFALADKYVEGSRYAEALPIAEQALVAYLRVVPAEAP